MGRVVTDTPEYVARSILRQSPIADLPQAYPYFKFWRRFFAVLMRDLRLRRDLPIINHYLDTTLNDHADILGINAEWTKKTILAWVEADKAKRKKRGKKK